MKAILILLSCFVVSLSMIAQHGSIKGHVLDNQTEEHLPGATIYIENTPFATMSDATGHFSITNIPDGTYIIVAKCIGFFSTRQEVSITQSVQKNVSLYLNQQNQELNEVSVIASKKKMEREISPTISNQLTTQTLESTNSTSLSQGLNYMPGLRVETNCQNCGTQEVRINGLQGQYSQMLIDGQPVFSALSKTYGLEQLPLNMIGKVDVIRGGGSVLFGSNAIGGVINIVTKEPERNSYEAKYNLSLIGGSSADNTFGLNSSFVDREKNLGISLFANMRNRNPWDANDDGFSEIGKNKASSLGFRAFSKTGLHDKLTFEYHYISEYRRGGDNMKRPPHEAMIAEMADYNIHSGGIGYTHFRKDNKHKLTANLSIQRTARDSYFGGGYDINAYGQTSELAATGSVRYEINMDRFLFMPSKITMGVTQEHTNLHDTIHSRNIKQVINISSAYIQNEWRNDQLSFNVGLRADKHSELNNINLIPRSSFRYRIKENINLRAAYSMGYRAPEITGSDLDIPIIDGRATILALGDDLKREYSNSVNGGIDFTFFNEKLYSYFLIEGFYTNINRVFVDEETGVDHFGNIIMTRKNGDGASVAGVNIEATVQPIDWVEIQGGFTWQKSRYTKPVQWSSESYVEPTKKMLRSPDNYGFFSIKATPKRNYSISLSGVYTGSMLAPHFAGAKGITLDETVRTKSFIDVTLKLSYSFNINSSNKLEINGGLQNMFNQIQKDFDIGPNRDSEYIYGPSLPRSVFIGLKISSL